MSRGHPCTQREAYKHHSVIVLSDRVKLTADTYQKTAVTCKLAGVFRWSQQTAARSHTSLSTLSCVVSRLPSSPSPNIGRCWQQVLSTMLAAPYDVPR